MATKSHSASSSATMCRAPSIRKHHLIVAHEVTNVGIDSDALSIDGAARRETRWPAMTIEVLADRGYFKGEEIVACEEAGIAVYVPKPHTSNARLRVASTEPTSSTIAEHDSYVCPAGEDSPTASRTMRTARRLRCYWTEACGDCALKAPCTTSKERRVARWEHEDVLERVQQRLDDDPDKMTAAAPDRRASVRHHQGLDGRDALQDEDAEARRHRDGVARAGLQSEAGDGDPRGAGLLKAMEGVRRAGYCAWSNAQVARGRADKPTPTKPSLSFDRIGRSHTASLQRRHRATPAKCGRSRLLHLNPDPRSTRLTASSHPSYSLRQATHDLVRRLEQLGRTSRIANHRATQPQQGVSDNAGGNGISPQLVDHRAKLTAISLSSARAACSNARLGMVHFHQS